MKRVVLGTGVGIAVIITAMHLSSPNAEEVFHHGYTIDSEGSVSDCLGCHDGQIAKSVSLSAMTASHPVNIVYPPADKPDGYVSADILASAGIRLVNGQVTCISCHNLKNQEPYHLAVTIEKSGICFSCHKI